MCPADVSAVVCEAIDLFKYLERMAHKNSKVRVYLFQRTIQFSFYRFNRRAVFATYNHRRDRGNIVTLLADRGGEMYEWIGDEWDKITSSTDVREINM